MNLRRKKQLIRLFQYKLIKEEQAALEMEVALRLIPNYYLHSRLPYFLKGCGETGENNQIEEQEKIL